MNSPRSINCPSGSGRQAALEEAGTGLVVYPNPTSDQVTLAFRLDAQEVAQLTIVDLQGRVVYTNKVMGASQTHNELISMRGQDSGTFVVRIVSNKRILTGKIVLIR